MGGKRGDGALDGGGDFFARLRQGMDTRHGDCGQRFEGCNIRNFYRTDNIHGYSFNADDTWAKYPGRTKPARSKAAGR
ncbi:hypothetical protein D3C72_1949470 [compost metagenome]